MTPPPGFASLRYTFCAALLLCGGSLHAAEKPQLLEAETFKPKAAAAYSDSRASGKQCVIALLPAGGRVFEYGSVLPAGDYVATAWIEAVPAALIHTLAITFTASGVERVIDQAQLDARPGFHPFPLRFFHPGGKVAITLDAAGKTGFDQMKASSGEAEKGVATTLDIDESTSGKKKKADTSRDELSELLEGAKSAESFTPSDLRVACDRVELTLIRAAPVAVSRVMTDKVHYVPGEQVSAKAKLLGGAGGGAFTFRAELITELDDVQEVFSSSAQLKAGEKMEVPFSFQLGAGEFGHELRCSLIGARREVVHSSSEYFGVSKNVYRVGITGKNVGQSTRELTPERAETVMANNHKQYANYFECFAWAPCDYSDLTPKTEEFVSGQTQYPGSVSGMKLQIATAHKHGVKAITYGKACGAGIAGFLTWQKHPEYFGHSYDRGPSTEKFSTYLLERMLENDYNFSRPSEGGWRHWASLWTRFNYDPTVDFGADELVRSAEMFGWDGVRWDGHFTENQRRCIDRINAKRPGYVHGYNSAFANAGSPLFLPPDQSDFHEIAKDHGVIMDESVRGHSRWTNGSMRNFYEAICREANYEKRIGGLPLFITFDMGSKQDVTWNVLMGLAAGQRYTYLTSPGDYAFGPLPKFLTRYSAFVWDDTALIAKAAEYFQVTPSAGAAANTALWYDQSAWLRKLPDGRQQVLLHLLNLPGYRNFAQRVQTPPTALGKVAVRAKIPAGAKLVRAFHVSPDLVEGHELLESNIEGNAATLSVPTIKMWSIVALEFEATPSQPLYPLTTPVEDAKKELANVALKKAHDEKLAAEKAVAGIGVEAAAATAKPPHANFEREYNADLEALAQVKGFVRPANPELRRNGIVDVHHARGVFGWLNPFDIALQLAGGGSYSQSWVDRVGFRLGPAGSMEDFPETYEQLFENDVIVLDNISAADLGAPRRTMIADFVKAGGGLMVMGGWFNLSEGADRNTALAEVLPVRIIKPGNLARDAAGFPLQAANGGFFSKVDWSRAGSSFQVDQSPLKESAEVLATAGGHPAIVRGTYGAGRVIVVLANPHGEPAQGATPYWESPEWPRILASCVTHLAKGSDALSSKTTQKRAVDPKKVLPTDLMLESASLAGPELAKRLRSAKDNMIDSESAQTVLRVALDNWNKVSDVDTLNAVVEAAGPFMNAGFVPLGEQMARSDLDVQRIIGYRVLGLAKSKPHRELIEQGLREPNVEAARAALLALSQIGDPAASPAVAVYLRTGVEKLLAAAVLRRLGTAGDFSAALEHYARALRRVTELHSGRKSLINTLTGGMAFSLTPAQRRQAQFELKGVVEMEARTKHDIAYFESSVGQPTEAEWKAFTAFLVSTTNPAVAPLAHVTFSKLPNDIAKPRRLELANAKVAQIRALAAE